MPPKKGSKKNASKTTSGSAVDAAPPSTEGRPPPRQRDPSTVPEADRSEQQARADEAEASALTTDSGSSRVSGESALTPDEVRWGAEFLRTVKQKLGHLDGVNLSRVLTSGLVGALNHDALTSLPTSEARSVGRPSAPSAPDVLITGHSKPAPEPPNPRAVAAASAAFISSRTAFAQDADTYASFPAVATDRQSAENELTRHLRAASFGGARLHWVDVHRSDGHRSDIKAALL